MNKLIFGTLTICTITALTSMAQADDRYQRKAVRPDFFVPEREFNKQERLPSFPALESESIKVNNKGQVLVKTEYYDEYDGKKNTDAAPQQEKELKVLRINRPAQFILNKKAEQQYVYDEYEDEEKDEAFVQNEVEIETPQPQQKQIVPAPVKKDYTPEDGLGDSLHQDKSYLAKEKAYEEDLKAMAETGAMPENAELKADLQKMNSEVSFSVK